MIGDQSTCDRIVVQLENLDVKHKKRCFDLVVPDI